MMPVCLRALVWFTTIFFAGIHLWCRSVLVLSVLTCVLAGMVSWFVRHLRDVDRHVKIIIDPLSLAGIFFALWVAVQVIPVPVSILPVISPRSSHIWETTRFLAGDVPSTVSLFPFMTVDSLMLLVAVLLFYWCALYGIRSRAQIQRVILGLLILGVLESLYGLAQLVSTEPHILWWKKLYGDDVASGTFINRDHFAACLSMLICLGVGYVWALGRKDRRVSRRKRSLYARMDRWGRAFGTKGAVLFLCIAVMLAGLLGSASRGGVLSLLTGLIFMGGLITARFFKNRNVFILMFILSVVGMYVGYVAADRVWERFQHIDSAFQTRLERSKSTIEMGKDFPVTGTGLGTFEFVYPLYSREKGARVAYAHNEWAQVFSETGGVGLGIVLAGFAAFLGVCIVRWRKRHDSFSVGVGLGGMGALVAISVHSLSDFNLHMPANALTLALILAVTYLSLFSTRHHGAERFLVADAPRNDNQRSYFDYPTYDVPVSRWAGVALILAAALGSGVIGTKVITTWRADFLARIFSNSTVPFEEPTDQQLKKAWHLAPGNATYWAWIADRVFARPEKTSLFLEGIDVGSHDPDVYLWSGGIEKNPTAWWIWRDLGWGAFAKQQKDPGYYLPLAARALSRAAELRPYSPRGYLEAGTAALACWKRGGSECLQWREQFKRALVLDPALAPKVTDQLVLYLGREGAYAIKDMLPDNSKSYVLTAGYLLSAGYPGPGIDILKAGEVKKAEEIAALLEKYRTSGKWSRQKGREIVRELLSRDAQNPTAFMLRGDLLKALQSQERRGGGLESLNNMRDTVWKLRGLAATKTGSPVEIAYFLGRIAEQDGDMKDAGDKYRKALRLNPQHFPAWIHLRDVLAMSAKTAGDRYELESLEKKIQLFSMDRFVASAWKWAGNYEGLPSWKAPFRVSRPVEGIDISFAGKGEGAWKLLLDGRFVDAWAGRTRKGSRAVAIPAGEHEMRLVHYGAVSPVRKEKPPFVLEIEFAK
jgi:tetratricopeptide (TPR) repeat protein